MGKLNCCKSTFVSVISSLRSSTRSFHMQIWKCQFQTTAVTTVRFWIFGLLMALYKFILLTNHIWLYSSPSRTSAVFNADRLAAVVLQWIKLNESMMFRASAATYCPAFLLYGNRCRHIAVLWGHKERIAPFRHWVAVNSGRGLRIGNNANQSVFWCHVTPNQQWTTKSSWLYKWPNLIMRDWSNNWLPASYFNKSSVLE